MTEGRAGRTVRIVSRTIANEVSLNARSRFTPSLISDEFRRQERAKNIRSMLENLGPIYIKFGQMLATRPDFVPQYVMDELAGLNDWARVEPFSVFEPVIEDELGAEWRSLFREIHTERPLGAASVAQVYKAVWSDGRPCVLKVQRPGSEAAMLGDMAVLRKIGDFVAKAAPHFCEVVDISAMLDVVFTAMESEVDFTREARNMKDARKAARRFKQLKVPKVIEATPRILVQTFAEGTPANRLKPDDLSKKKRKKIAYQLMAFMYRSYFVDRAFHADPHPGNVLISPDGKAHIIDWGMYGKLDRTTALTMLNSILAVARGDGQAMARHWIKVGSTTPWSNSARFVNDVARTIPYWANMSLEELNFGVALMSLVQHATAHGVQLSPVISLMSKSMGNIEGTVRYIYPKLKLDRALRECLPDIIRDVLFDSFSAEYGAQLLLDLLHSVNVAPAQLQSVLRDATDGRLGIHARTNLGDPVAPKQRQRVLNNTPLASTAATVAVETMVRRAIANRSAKRSGVPSDR